MLKYQLNIFSVAILCLLFFDRTYAQNFVVNAPADAYTSEAWLDLRYLNEGVAGENGFIKLSPDGKSFLNGKGVPLRFWAVNGGGAASELNDA
ncbi:MAG: hypothetical protein WKI04_16670, partial [Ferruginibacter sp.]